MTWHWKVILKIDFCMKIKIVFLFLCLTQSGVNQSDFKVPIQDPKKIFKAANFAAYYYSLKFSEDYFPLNTSSEVITKSEFYRKILDSDFVPVKITQTILYTIN